MLITAIHVQVYGYSVGCERDRDSAIRTLRRAEGAIIDTTADTHPDNRHSQLFDDDNDDDMEEEDTKSKTFFSDSSSDKKKKTSTGEAKNPQPCVSIVDLVTNDTGFHFDGILDTHVTSIFQRYMTIASSWTVESAPYTSATEKTRQAKAMYVVGRCYNEGLGVAIDRTRTIEWHQRGAEQLDDLECICAWAWAFELGEGVAKDQVKAFDLQVIIILSIIHHDNFLCAMYTIIVESRRTWL
jgi:TPR repeat protein